MTFTKSNHGLSFFCHPIGYSHYGVTLNIERLWTHTHIKRLTSNNVLPTCSNSPCMTVLLSIKVKPVYYGSIDLLSYGSSDVSISWRHDMDFTMKNVGVDIYINVTCTRHTVWHYSLLSWITSYIMSFLMANLTGRRKQISRNFDTKMLKISYGCFS